MNILDLEDRFIGYLYIDYLYQYYRLNNLGGYNFSFILPKDSNIDTDVFAEDKKFKELGFIRLVWQREDDSLIWRRRPFLYKKTIKALRELPLLQHLKYIKRYSWGLYTEDYDLIITKLLENLHKSELVTYLVDNDPRIREIAKKLYDEKVRLCG